MSDAVSLDLDYADRIPVCPEDSTFRKGISCIPCVGLFFGWIQEFSLISQILETRRRVVNTIQTIATQ